MKPYYVMVGRIAGWLHAKYQEQARLNGVQYAARNMRKQGIPLEFAVHILACRPPLATAVRAVSWPR